MTKSNAVRHQQPDVTRDIVLLGTAERVPPLAEIIRVFDEAFHSGNMPWMAYFVKIWLLRRVGLRAGSAADELA